MINEKISYDEQNIAEVRRIVNNKEHLQARFEKSSTLIQKNSPCNPKITESSRKKCATALLK